MDRIRANITDAIRYWEKGRLLYNGVLVLITIGVYIWARLNGAVHFPVPRLITLFFLAVAANLFYCFAYPVDLFVQCSDFKQTWKRYRWVLFLIGMLIASVLTVFAALNLFASPLLK